MGEGDEQSAVLNFREQLNKCGRTEAHSDDEGDRAIGTLQTLRLRSGSLPDR